MKDAGRLDWRGFLDSRTVASEMVATEAVIAMAAELGCRAHICHISHPAVADKVVEARANGVRISAETCGHYLSFTEEDVIKNGPMFKCAPPLRTAEAVEGMPAAAFAGEGASGTDKITLTQTVGDIVITLTADKGVFPDNVTLSAEEITNKSDVGKIEEAVGDAAGPDERVTETRSFDIKVLTAAKEEVQPDTSAGSIELSFANVGTKDTNGDAKNIDVYHVSDAMTAAEPVATAVDTASDSVSISPKHFSIYTVTVTVDETASSTAGIKYFEGATKATSYFEIENQASLEAYAKIINGGAATPVVAIEYINEDGVT